MPATASRWMALFVRALILAGLLLLAWAILGLVSSGAEPAASLGDPGEAAGSAFTYQGELRQGSEVYEGRCDFQFRLWDADTGGRQVAPTPPHPLQVPDWLLCRRTERVTIAVVYARVLDASPHVAVPS